MLRVPVVEDSGRWKGGKNARVARVVFIARLLAAWQKMGQRNTRSSLGDYTSRARRGDKLRQQFLRWVSRDIGLSTVAAISAVLGYRP